MNITVTCPDGEVRHEPFERRSDAERWAEWGHCCVGGHTFKETMPAVEVGAFFKCSWGYDQTNVDFYKVVGVSATGKTIKVQMWSSSADGDRRVPGDKPRTYPRWRDGQLVGEADAAVETRRVQHYSDRPAFHVNSYSDAYLWDGQPAYETPVGAGH